MEPEGSTKGSLSFIANGNVLANITRDKSYIVVFPGCDYKCEHSYFEFEVSDDDILKLKEAIDYILEE